MLPSVSVRLFNRGERSSFYVDGKHHKAQSVLKGWNALRILQPDGAGRVREGVTSGDLPVAIDFRRFALDRFLVDSKGQITPARIIVVNELGATVWCHRPFCRVNLVQVVVAAVAPHKKRSGTIWCNLLLDALVVVDVTGQHHVGHASGIPN